MASISYEIESLDFGSSNRICLFELINGGFTSGIFTTSLKTKKIASFFISHMQMRDESLANYREGGGCIKNG